MSVTKKAIAGVLVFLFNVSFALGGDHHTLRFLYPDSRSPKPALSLAISPDGAELALSVEPGTVHFVRLSDGEQISQITANPFSMRYSKDGSRLLMLTTNASFLLNTKTRQKVSVDIRDQPGYVGLGTVNRNGKLLVNRLHAGGPAATSGRVSIGDEIVGYCEGRNGEWRDAIGMLVDDFSTAIKGPIRTHLQIRILKKGESEPQTVFLTRQSARIAGDALEFRETPLPIIEDNLLSCRFGDRMTFVSTRDGSAVASLATEQVQIMGKHDISPDYHRTAKLASLKNSRSKYGIEVFDLLKLERTLFTPFDRDSYCDLRFSADGKELFAASVDRVDVLDADSGQFMRSYRLDGIITNDSTEDRPKKNNDTNGSSLGLSAIGASADRSGYVPDAAPSSIAAIAVSKTLIAIASPDGHVSLWSLASGELQKKVGTGMRREDVFRRHSAPLIEFSDDGKWLVFYVHGVLNILQVDGRSNATGEPSAFDS
jgi:WD40 repeat protein